MGRKQDHASKRAGYFIKNAEIIEQALECVVAPVHHTGKDADRGPRGWSGLNGANDTEWAVSEKEDRHVVHIPKMRDGEAGIEWQFALKVVPIGVDEDNELVTTCIVDLQSEPAKTVENAKKKAILPATTAAKEKAEEIFMKLLKWKMELGFELSPSPQSPWLYAPKVFAEHDECEGFTKQAFGNAMERLISKKLIEIVVKGKPSNPIKKLAISVSTDAYIGGVTGGNCQGGVEL